MKSISKILFAVLGVALFAAMQLAAPSHTVGGQHVILGMALTAQVPQAWKARIEAYLNKAPVFLQALTNRHYEGEMKTNGTLNIVSIGEITTGDYTGADITFADLATTGITFVLDKTKYFAFQVDDTITYNSMVNLQDGGSKKAAERMARDIDDYIAALHSSITSNVYGSTASPIIVGFDAVAGEVLPSVALAKLQQTLAEANADQSGVNTVIPPWMASYLLAEFGRKNSNGGDSASESGVVIGKLDFQPIAGFKEIWVSNNCVNTAGTAYKVMAGTPDSSITFANALNKVETGRQEKKFGSFVKGLSIYGGKVPYEQHMVLGTFNQGTQRQS